MTDFPRLPTGTTDLDRVLGGGVPAASILVLAGLPGAGKTVLAEQFLFANASERSPALYLTTLSEPLEKAVRYLQAFAFFDPERMLEAITYRDLGQPVQEGGIAALPAIVEAMIAERDATLLVIDSFKALHDLAPDPVAFRAALFELAQVLTATGVTAILVGEYRADEIAALPEFAVADGVVELRNTAHGVRDERTLRVHKLRGAAYLAGEHSFRIGPEGITVFPRLVGEDVRAARQVRRARVRIPSGIPNLDPLLGGGLWRGSVTLVAGPSGVGKTMFGLKFLLEAAKRGKRGVLMSFQEPEGALGSLAEGMGADLEALERDGLLRVQYTSPLELDLVELFGRVTELLERGHAEKLVIDSLGDIREAAIEPGRYRSVVWNLSQYLTHHSVTGLLLQEMTLGKAPGVLTDSDLSYMADNILLLSYLRPPTNGYDRAIEVVKTRASGHDSSLHPFSITEAGPEIAEWA